MLNRAALYLLMFKGRQRIGVEFKRADAPHVTTSMRIAMHDLKVEAVPLWTMLPPHRPIKQARPSKVPAKLR